MKIAITPSISAAGADAAGEKFELIDLMLAQLPFRQGNLRNDLGLEVTQIGFESGFTGTPKQRGRGFAKTVIFRIRGALGSGCGHPFDLFNIETNLQIIGMLGAKTDKATQHRRMRDRRVNANARRFFQLQSMMFMVGGPIA